MTILVTGAAGLIGSNIHAAAHRSKVTLGAEPQAGRYGEWPQHIVFLRRQV